MKPKYDKSLNYPHTYFILLKQLRILFQKEQNHLHKHALKKISPAKTLTRLALLETDRGPYLQDLVVQQAQVP